MGAFWERYVASESCIPYLEVDGGNNGGNKMAASSTALVRRNHGDDAATLPPDMR